MWCPDCSTAHAAGHTRRPIRCSRRASRGAQQRGDDVPRAVKAHVGSALVEEHSGGGSALRLPGAPLPPTYPQRSRPFGKGSPRPPPAVVEPGHPAPRSLFARSVAPAARRAPSPFPVVKLPGHLSWNEASANSSVRPERGGELIPSPRGVAKQSRTDGECRFHDAASRNCICSATHPRPTDLPEPTG